MGSTQMKADHFRRLAPSAPQATEGAHMDYPDFIDAAPTSFSR